MLRSLLDDSTDSSVFGSSDVRTTKKRRPCLPACLAAPYGAPSSSWSWSCYAHPKMRDCCFCPPFGCARLLSQLSAGRCAVRGFRLTLMQLFTSHRGAFSHSKCLWVSHCFVTEFARYRQVLIFVPAVLGGRAGRKAVRPSVFLLQFLSRQPFDVWAQLLIKQQRKCVWCGFSCGI